MSSPVVDIKEQYVKYDIKRILDLLDLELIGLLPVKQRIREIAERAEVSYRAVMYFMKGESNSRAIYQAAIRLINQKNQNDLEQVVTRQKALSALI